MLPVLGLTLLLGHTVLFTFLLQQPRFHLLTTDLSQAVQSKKIFYFGLVLRDVSRLGSDHGVAELVPVLGVAGQNVILHTKLNTLLSILSLPATDRRSSSHSRLQYSPGWERWGRWCTGRRRGRRRLMRRWRGRGEKDIPTSLPGLSFTASHQSLA